jgi:hypothetical protein
MEIPEEYTIPEPIAHRAFLRSSQLIFGGLVRTILPLFTSSEHIIVIDSEDVSFTFSTDSTSTDSTGIVGIAGGAGGIVSAAIDVVLIRPRTKAVVTIFIIIYFTFIRV